MLSHILQTDNKHNQYNSKFSWTLLCFSTVTHHTSRHQRWQRTLGTFSSLQFIFQSHDLKLPLPLVEYECQVGSSLRNVYNVSINCEHHPPPPHRPPPPPIHLQPAGLCSGGSSACSHDQHHPGVSCPDTFPVGPSVAVLLKEMHVRGDKYFPISCFIRILTRSSLDHVGAEFLCSVVLTLPKLTSLRWGEAHFLLLSVKMIFAHLDHCYFNFIFFAVLFPKGVGWTRGWRRLFSRPQIFSAWSECTRFVFFTTFWGGLNSIS